MNGKLATATAILLLTAIIPAAFLSGSSKANKELYVEHCAKCHRKDGSGIKGVYPPLKNADYVAQNDAIELLRGMLYGRSGKIKVNGVTYNGVMTTEIDASLSDDNIASILNYVYGPLNGMSKTVNADDVKKARKAGKLPVKK